MRLYDFQNLKYISDTKQTVVQIFFHPMNQNKMYLETWELPHLEQMPRLYQLPP